MTFNRLPKEQAKTQIAMLVEAYKRQAAEVERPSSAYTETETRGEFIDRFLIALGWDVHNQAGVSQLERDVVLEHGGDDDGKAIGRPDYRLRVDGKDRLPFEAKKPSVKLATSPASSLQARSYGWSLSLPAAVLTNFAELAIFDTTVTPKAGDGPDVALLPGLRLNYDQYVARFDELWERLSFQSVSSDAFYDVYSYEEPPRGTSPFDVTFLETFRQWRSTLASDIAKNNQTLQAREVGRRTQRVLNALLFLRVCEDRNIGQYEGLLRSAQASAVVDAFRNADRAFNAGLFTVLDNTVVTDGALSAVIKQLYWPRTKFAFGVLSPDILAAVYEQYLAERVELSGDRNVTLVEKPELTHAGGIVPTPEWIVEELLTGALTPLIQPGHAPAVGLAVLDPACGSGVFLVAALRKLLAASTAAGEIDTLGLRAQLAKEHLYGVDLDAEAVEVAKLSLLLAVLGDDVVDVGAVHDLLPDLSSNVITGNALVDSTFDSVLPTVAQLTERRAAVAPLDLNTSLAPLRDGHGFDAVICNPPYTRIQTLKQFLPDQLNYFQDARSGFESSKAFNFDTYMLFIERALSILSSDGHLGMIVPNRFTNSLAGGPVRAVLGTRLTRLVHFRETQVFPNRSTYACLIFASGTQSGDADLQIAGDIVTFRDGKTAVESLERALLTADPWPIASDAQKAVFEKMELASTALMGDAGWVNIFVGVQTSADKLFFIQPDEARSTPDVVMFKDVLNREWEIERAILRSAVQDATIQPFDRDPAPDSLAIFPYEIEPPSEGKKRGKATLYSTDEMIARFPKALAYLTHHETALRQRAVNITDGKFWAYGRTQSLTKLDDPKLIVQVLSVVPRYSIDTTGLLVPGGGDGGPYYLLRPHDNCPLSIETLLAVLSHPIVDAYVASRGRAYRGSYVVHRKRFLSIVPMPALTPVSITRLKAIVLEMNELIARVRVEPDSSKVTSMKGRLDVLREESQHLVAAGYGLGTAEVAALVG